MSRTPALTLTLGLVVLSVLLVGTVWIVPYLPTNDGPQAILAVHIENHFADPGTIYRDVFRPAPQFAGRGFTILFEPLEDLLGWQRGLQVALSIILLVEAWGFVALVRAVDPRRMPLAFLGFPLALSWPFYMGFFPFVFASGVGLLILSVAVRPMTPARRVSLAALLLAQTVLHMFAAMLTGFVIAVTLVLRAPRGRRVAEVAKACLMGLPAAALAVTAVLVARESAVKVASSLEFLGVRNTLLWWPQTVVPGPVARALAGTLLVASGAAVAGLRAVQRDTLSIDRAFSIVAVLFILAGLLAPWTIPGWQAFSQRFPWLGVVLLIVALPFEELSSHGEARGISALLFTGAVLWTGLSYPFHRRLAATYADAIAGLSARVLRHACFLPVTLEPSPRATASFGEPEVPFLAPLTHIGLLFAVAEGGLTPYTFATNSATWPFTIRPDAPSPGPVPLGQHYAAQLTKPEFQTDRAFRGRVEDELAMVGMFYEGVLLTGARPGDIALWKRRGYVADWEQGSVMVGHFEPCRIDVVVPREAPAPQLDVGIDVAVAGPMLENLSLSPVRGADGADHLVVERGPCGRVWVRPHWEAAPASPGAAPGTTFCENAASSGEIEATVTRTEGRVECTGMRRDASPP